VEADADAASASNVSAIADAIFAIPP
jgi:hypothetical protein